MPVTRRKKTAVLASGGGTNLQALIDACARHDHPAEITLVLSNNTDAYGLERARKAGIATAVVDHRGYPDRESFDAAIQAVLEDAGIEIVCLAGFMRILTDGFVNAWRDRMLNIHPSLLPAYRGLNTHQRALDDGATRAGCTVHLVRPDLDSGPMILQAEVPVLPGDDADTLAKRVLFREHEIYPAALNLFAAGRVTVEAEVAFIDGAPGPKRLTITG